jgi:hypothetical protein
MITPTPLQTEFVFEANVTCDAMVAIGDSSRGRRQLIPITGGEFVGPQLKGRVLPGGADWQLIRADGVVEIEARYTIQTEDGVNISVCNRGVTVYPPDFNERRARGEALDPMSIYVRTTPEFEAPSDSAYAWLNRLIFVGTVQVVSRTPLVVQVRVFKVL